MAIERSFSVAQREIVRGLLAEYTGTEELRVKIAVLVLADGNQDDLVDFLRCAKVDYRDVLYWAEYPEVSATGKTKKQIAAVYEKLGVVVPGPLR